MVKFCRLEQNSRPKRKYCSLSYMKMPKKSELVRARRASTRKKKVPNTRWSLCARPPHRVCTARAMSAPGWNSRSATQTFTATWGICRRRAGKLSKLNRARSQLYRSQILQENMRWKALAETYTMHSFAPFSNLTFVVKHCWMFC